MCYSVWHLNHIVIFLYIWKKCIKSTVHSIIGCIVYYSPKILRFTVLHQFVYSSMLLQKFFMIFSDSCFSPLTLKLPTFSTCPGGPLVFEVGYHPRKKKITSLGLIFRTRQCTHVHRLGVQKRAKLEKRVCFWSYWQILERTWHSN